ncbi:topoisomerase DNA-binding C4 zinc finger domain-containing protein [Methanobrevibacter sp.]|uniref:topoisomerase DNA-binding C4 zinc finger domain-containing protein n=1 Tax=Methanobrevibacter sp. TaxID=66852 RepID=UPI003869C269
MKTKRSRVNFNHFTITIKKGEVIGDIINKLTVNMPVGKCPICGENLVIRKSKYGKFIGCDGFKNGCKKTYNPEYFTVPKDFEIFAARKGFELHYSLIGFPKEEVAE